MMDALSGDAGVTMRREPTSDSHESTAFAQIILLWLSLVATWAAFLPLSRAAGWRMVPYLAGVAFASTLNYAIWRLNA